MAKAAAYDEILDAFYSTTVLLSFSSSLVWGVNTLFLMESGLSVHQTFAVGASFAGSGALFALPAGAVADVFGRRRAVLAGTLLLSAATLLYAVLGLTHAGLGALCAAAALLAPGYALSAGALEAWAVDALRDTGSPHTLETVFSRAAFLSGAGFLFGLAVGGLLAGAHAVFPYILRSACFLCAVLLVYKRVRDLGFERKGSILSLPAEVRKSAAAAVHFGWREKRARRLVVAGCFQALAAGWGYYAWQPYLTGFLGRSEPRLMGLFAAAAGLAVMGGNAALSRIERFCARRTTLLLCSAGVFATATLGVGAAGTVWSAGGFYLLAAAALGVFAPARRAFLHRVAPGEYRTSAAAFASAAEGASCMLGQSVLGAAVAVRSLDFGYAAGGFAALGALPAVLALRMLGEEGDFFRSKAGTERPEPAQGHPNVI